MLGVLVMQGLHSSQEGGSDIITKSQVLGLMSSIRSVVCWIFPQHLGHFEPVNIDCRLVAIVAYRAHSWVGLMIAFLLWCPVEYLPALRH